MIRDNSLATRFYQVLVEDNRVERENHIPSGKLSASTLGDPLQWQVLKTIGATPKPFDEYVLGMFARGKSVEDFVIEKLGDCVLEQQKEVEYRGVIGYVDALIDTKGFNYENGILPHEIKSVKNSKFKRIMTAKETDEQHRLQATLYALAMGVKEYAIVYVAADDLRIETFIYRTEDLKDRVDTIIDNFNSALKKGVIPEFEAIYSWQEKEDYCKYPQFLGKTPDEITEMIRKVQPECLEKLNNLKENA